jgi:hypothetical protein
MLRFVVLSGFLAAVGLAGCVGFDDHETYHFILIQATSSQGAVLGAPVQPCPARPTMEPPQFDERDETLAFFSPPRNQPEFFDLEDLHGLILVITNVQTPCDNVFVDAYPLYGQESDVEVHLAELGTTVIVHLHEEGAEIEDHEGGTVVLDPGEQRAYTVPGGDYTVTAMGNWPVNHVDFVGEDDGDDAPHEDPDDRSSSYVFAWITGNYAAHPPPGEEGYAGICGFPSPPDVDEEAKSITFHSAGREEVEDKHIVDLRGLVLLTQWDRSACGVLVTNVEIIWSAEEPTVMIDLLGDLTLGMRLNRDDGSVTLFQDETPEENAVQVSAGGSHSGNYSGGTEDGGTFEADYALRAMGHWPTEGIILAEGGSADQPV